MLIFKKSFSVILTIILTLSIIFSSDSKVYASGFSIVILSQYSRTMNISDSFYLTAYSSSGKKISWKSSSSSIASVNVYGEVTAKKAGTCKITAKTSDAEASCTINVQRTVISLSDSSLHLENGATRKLSYTTSNRSKVTWYSSKKSVASISYDGLIEAHKPGNAIISAKSDGTTATCKVTVDKPTIYLSDTKLSMYRKKTVFITASVSSKRKVSWKSSKTNVATINENGMITSIKHGTSIIKASLDGVTKTCALTVKSPNITLNKTSAKIKKGKLLQLRAQVSSGNTPTWKSSKTSIATVDNHGLVKGIKAGKCCIYVSEDGTKKKCSITVTK